MDAFIQKVCESMKAQWILLGLLCLGLAGCGMDKEISIPSGKAQDQLVENIKVENYFETGVNREYFTSIPQRVIVIGANETETLLDLGVEKTIIGADDGQNSAHYGIKECNKRKFQALPKIDRRTITSEHMLEIHPDLIIAEQQFFSKRYLGSTDYWNQKGIYTMVPLNTTSPGKLNQEETVDKEMKYIQDLGKIFHQEMQAEKIVNATYDRIQKVRETVADEPKPKVMILDKMSILASYGRKKIAGDMVTSIGGLVPDTMAAVSDEQMMKINPDVVFLVVYRDEESELDWIRNKPAYRNLNFIKNHRLYGIPLKYVYGPQTRTIDAIGFMAERMYPGKFHFPKETTF